MDYDIGRALDNAEAATVLVFVGTSHAVGITAMMMATAGGNDIPIFNIDPHQGVGLGGGVIALWEQAEVILPRLAAALVLQGVYKQVADDLDPEVAREIAENLGLFSDD